MAVAAGQHGPRDHEDGAVGVLVEGEAAEGDRAGAGGLHGVVDVRLTEDGGQPPAGPGEPAGAGRHRHAGGLTPSDQALAVSDPGVGRRPGEGGQQVTGVADKGGANRQRAGCSERDTHPRHSMRELNTFDSDPRECEVTGNEPGKNGMPLGIGYHQIPFGLSSGDMKSVPNWQALPCSHSGRVIGYLPWCA